MSNTTPAQGIMFKFTYRENPRLDPDRVFDVIRFFPGTDATLLKHSAMNHAAKTGAIGVISITPEQYKELINEEAERTQTTTVTKEEN